MGSGALFLPVTAGSTSNDRSPESGHWWITGGGLDSVFGTGILVVPAIAILAVGAAQVAFGKKR